MADSNQTDDDWAKLFRLFPARPLRAVLGDRPPAPPAPAWEVVRARAAHLLSDARDDILPSSLAALRSWSPEVAAEVTAPSARPALVAALERVREGLRALPAGPDDAAEALDALERGLKHALLGCGERTANAVLFAGARRPERLPTDAEPPPEDRRRALLQFVGWVAAKLTDGGE